VFGEGVQRCARVGGTALALATIALGTAPVASGSADVIYGVSDPRFTALWPDMAPKIEPLRPIQVGIWLNYDCENPTWRLPASQPLLVTLRAQCRWPSPGAYAAATSALVAAHPNIREIQVWNEPDLSWIPRTGELYTYLDLLAATHDALQGTGVKVLGFGFSPVKPRPKFVALLVRWWYESRHWPRPIMDGYAYHPYWDWDSRYSAVLERWMDKFWEGLPQPSPADGLRFWWTETGMWSSGVPWRDMVGTPQQQAARVAAVAQEAYCNPLVAADFNFLLEDEPDGGGWPWKSGLYFIGGKPKPALYAFRDAIRAARSGASSCPSSRRRGYGLQRP
jgi:hypothetical protein